MKTQKRVDVPLAMGAPEKLLTKPSNGTWSAQISIRTVNRLLSEMDLKPHRSRYWLNATPDCPETFQREVMELCQTYEQAPALLSKGIHVISVDEKTGIQALERATLTNQLNQDELNDGSMAMSVMAPVV